MASQPAPAADLVVYVCGRPFPANRSLMASASPYFAALLAASPGEQHLALPSFIPPDVFAILLADIHSGGSLTLALTADNVRQVMLYAQILHLPAAVQACKEFVEGEQQRRSISAAGILKPIASRPLMRSSQPMLKEENLYGANSAATAAAAAAAAALAWRQVWVSTQEVHRNSDLYILHNLFQPWHFATDLQSKVHHFVSPALATADKIRNAAPFLPMNQAPYTPSIFAAAPSSHSHATPPSEEPLSVYPTPEVTQEPILKSPSNIESTPNPVRQEPEPGPSTSSRPAVSIEDIEMPALDVAACDGPVTFRRIPNPCLRSASRAGSDSSHNSSGGGTNEPATQKKGGKSKSSGKCYKCLFCNHAFKSHYCYQKHKRRHINPLAVDYEKDSDENSGGNNDEDATPPGPSSSSCAEQKSASQLQLRDINVQFFPCKLCGDKFPSYYFVHKHKKMWHKEELAQEEAAAAVAAAAAGAPGETPKKGGDGQ